MHFRYNKSESNEGCESYTTRSLRCLARTNIICTVNQNHHEGIEMAWRIRMRSLWVDICRGNWEIGELRKRMNEHRSSINTGGNQLLYKHFNLPDHSVLFMKVRILEKIYHRTNSPGLAHPFVGNGRNTGSDNWELLPHMVATITLIALGILPVLGANQ